MTPKKTPYPTSYQVSANSSRIIRIADLVNDAASDLFVSEPDAKKVRDKIDELRSECRVFNSIFNYSHSIP